MIIECRVCKRKLEHTPENFHRKKGALNGLRNICKECSYKEFREWRNKNVDKVQRKRIEFDKNELIALRKKLELNQIEMAEILGMSFYNYRDYEQGKRYTMSPSVYEEFQKLLLENF